MHRDIKPSNLMLTREGRLKVIDLGLALWGDDVSAHLTREDNVMGTFAYCAPEQFRNASQVDIRADIYSLGCTLFHLLTGRPPYGRGRTLTEIVQAHLNEPFPPLPEARPDAPAGLQAVIARMTAKDRENRYSTPREVVEAINPYSNASDLVKLVPPASRQGAPPPRPPKGNPGKPGHTGKASQPQGHFSRRAALLAGVPVAVGGFFLGRQFPSKDWVRTKTLDQKFARWQVLYDLLDDKLACFIGHLGTVSPNTKFLIYSRGTDRNWVSPGFQQGWVGEIETRFPALNTNRVFTMTITPAMGEKRASFKHEETAKIMGKKVSEILGLKPGTVTPKQVVFLMDTSSRKGVYDEENMGTANTNAEELRKVLSRELNGDPNVKVALSFQTFNISDKSSKRNWDGEETVLKEKPSLVLFHRSAFFHVVNAEVGLGYPVYESPDSDKPVAWEEWKE